MFRDDPAGQAIWTLRFLKGCRAAARQRLFSQPQEDRTAVAFRRPAISKTAQEMQAALPQRQFDHPAATATSKSHPESRFCPRQTEQRTAFQDVDGVGRIHHRGAISLGQAENEQCRHAGRALSTAIATWKARIHPLRQWLRQYARVRPHQALDMRPPAPETE